MKIGDPAPDFRLPGTDGRTYGLDDFQDAKVLVVVQMCNHCPYVIGYQDRMMDLARRTAPLGVAFVGINSNDAVKYPSDSLANMTTRAQEIGLPFPYLHDEDQSAARSFGSQRTPEFFVFNADRKLVYHGRLDDNLEEPDEVETAYLEEAIHAALAGQRPANTEVPAVGCTVKWK